MILGVVAILAVVAVPCESFSVVFANRSMQPATVRITVPRWPAQAVWSGTVNAGETRDIPLIATVGGFKLHVVAQVPGRRERVYTEDIENSGFYSFQSDRSCLRLTNESLQLDDCPPSFSLPSDWGALYGSMSCQDYDLRQGLRRWIANSPFRRKSLGGAQ